MLNIAEWVEKAHTEVGRDWEENNGCWLSRTNQIQITGTTGPHSNQVFASITVTRLLTFFFDPTPTNWQKLSGPNPEESPFDHRCHRGWLRNNNTAMGCLNVKDHGGFGTKDSNEGRKECKDRCLALCPGHGEFRTCVYTHITGEEMPCRMVPDHLPVCRCVKKCFGT